VAVSIGWTEISDPGGISSGLNPCRLFTSMRQQPIEEIRAWRPLPCPALSLGDLSDGHRGGDDVADIHPPVPVLARRLSDGEAEPHVRFDVVPRDAATGPVGIERFRSRVATKLQTS